MDEADGSTVDGLVIDVGGGTSLPSAGVSDRRRRRLGGRAGGVHPAAQAAPRRQRHGVRADPAPRSHPRELPARRAGQGHADDGQPGRGRHRASSRTTSTSSRPTPTSRSTRGRLTLVSRALDGRRSHLSVDGFLRSLAADRGSHAIGVVLSGNASDGTEGLRAIKARERHHASRRIRSRRSTARCRATRSTPASSTTALAIPELARELVRLSRHPYVAAAEGPPAAGDARRPQSDPDGRAQRIRRRLRRVQARDRGAPAGAQDGAPPRAGSCRPTWRSLQGDPEEVARPL